MFLLCKLRFTAFSTYKSGNQIQISTSAVNRKKKKDQLIIIIKKIINRTRIQSTIDLSALSGYMLQFLKRNTRPREKTPGIKNPHLSALGFIEYMEVDITIELSANPSLQEGLTSLDNLKDNRSFWFLYNVHTWTGNRLLSSTQPP